MLIFTLQTLEKIQEHKICEKVLLVHSVLNYFLTSLKNNICHYATKSFQ